MIDEKEKIRKAFSKIREDMDSFQNEINEIKQYLHDLHDYLKSSTHPQHFDTQTQEIKGIKPQILISKGNEGVPADSQQTFDTSKTLEIPKKLTLGQVKKIVNNLQQDLKFKFKNLSKQEFYIFSLVYNLDIQGQKPDYKTIAIRANLTESSVRDYISRLIHKGIPLKKEKINNKLIKISVPDELKNLATLDNLTKISQYNTLDLQD
jgi:predicted transcriptional regulator